MNVYGIYGNEHTKVRRGSRAPSVTGGISKSLIDSTPTGGSMRSLRNSLRRAVQEAIGHVSVDKAGENLYLTAEGCIRVRRTMPIDGLIENEMDQVDSFYSTTLRPLIEKVYTDDKNLVLMVSGDSNVNKSQLIHGQTFAPEYADVELPPMDKWGVAYHAIDDLIGMNEEAPPEIKVTACRVHLDHIADALVSSTGTRLTKGDAKTKRNQFARLLAISSSSALELEEVDNRSVILDQVDVPIKDTSDFTHVVNCFAALNSGKLYLKLGQKRASPFHYVISIRVWRPDRAEPRFLQIVEMADSDYHSSVEDETIAFRAVHENILNICNTMHLKDHIKLKSVIRQTTLMRVAMGNLDLADTNLAIIGLSRFQKAADMMEYLAKCKQASIRIVLHGPDGEGEDDVDPELKQHVQEIQQRCIQLQSDVSYLQDEKLQVEERIADGKKAINKLEQQLSVMKTLQTAGSTVVSKRPSFRTADTSSVKDTKAAAEERARLRLAALERDLRVMKEEDERKAEATAQQIKYMNAERIRCANKTKDLQKELEVLRGKLSKQEEGFSKDRQVIETEMQNKINDAIWRNTQEIEAYNESQRTKIENSLRKSAEDEARQQQREEEVAEAVKRYSDDVHKQLASASTKWLKEREELESKLERLQKQRLVLQREKVAVDAALEKEVESMDIQSTSLAEYAHKMSKLIWRLENHNSTEARRIINYPGAGVQVFDPTMTHTVEWFEKQCRSMRKWLDERGYPRPAVHYDLKSGVVTILDVEKAKLQSKVATTAAGAQTDPIVVPKPVRDYSGVMAESLDAAAENIKVVESSRDRLASSSRARSASRQRQRGAGPAPVVISTKTPTKRPGSAAPR